MHVCVLYPAHLWATDSPSQARWPFPTPDAHRRRRGRDLADAGDEAQPLHPVKTQQQGQMGRVAACEVRGETSSCGHPRGSQRRRHTHPCVARCPAREGVSPTAGSRPPAPPQRSSTLLLSPTGGEGTNDLWRLTIESSVRLMSVEARYGS